MLAEALRGPQQGRRVSFTIRKSKRPGKEKRGRRGKESGVFLAPSLPLLHPPPWVTSATGDVTCKLPMTPSPCSSHNTWGKVVSWAPRLAAESGERRTIIINEATVDDSD
ncbi:hypothetical protein E2C01_046148 [Portunus trituberculatus]|uniref:Uncharacterized protein n=1 Tax=Portunus trituberculatus TaxID=210409 RepID=A0A5B7G6U7_PORTR|nr:hypothetical protein [Portunus trituberculatus]